MKVAAYSLFGINALIFGVFTIFAMHFGPYQGLSFLFVAVMVAGPPVLLAIVLSTFVFLYKRCTQFLIANCGLAFVSLVGSFFYIAVYGAGV